MYEKSLELTELEIKKLRETEFEVTEGMTVEDITNQLVSDANDAIEYYINPKMEEQNKLLNNPSHMVKEMPVCEFERSVIRETVEQVYGKSTIPNGFELAHTLLTARAIAVFNVMTDELDEHPVVTAMQEFWESQKISVC